MNIQIIKQELRYFCGKPLACTNLNLKTYLITYFYYTIFLLEIPQI